MGGLLAIYGGFVGWLGLLLSRAALQSLAVTGAFLFALPRAWAGVQSVDVTLLCSALFENWNHPTLSNFGIQPFPTFPYTEAAQRCALKRPLIVARGDRRVLVRLGLHGF